MHEISIARNLAEIIIETVPENELHLIDTVKVSIGLLSNVLPDSLISGFDLIKENTPFSSARLVIYKIPVSVGCRSCGSTFSSDDFIFQCLDCGGSDIEVTGGNELNLSEIILQ